MRRREMLKATLAGFSAFPLAWTAAAEPARQRILFYTASAGFQHSVVKRHDGRLSHAEQVLTEMGRRAGFEVECTRDGTVFDGDLSPYGAFAFYASGDLTKPNVDQAPPMTAAGKQRFLDAVAAGKGFVGFHAATDAFHTAPPAPVDPYIALVGGEAIGHGPQQEASLLMIPKFPGVRDIGCAEGLSFFEEWYAMKNFASDLSVILIQETDKMVGDCYRRPPYPSTWARRHGQGRVFYSSLGHREDIWTNPFFQAIALGGIAWALGNAAFDPKPNIQQVTPHANQLPG